MTLFLIAAILMLVASFADGFTTQLCIKKGDIETNRVLDFIYGTNKPTALQEYGIGLPLELAPIGLYLLFHHVAGIGFWIFDVLLFAETVVHIACAISNYKLATTGKALFTL